MTESRQSESRHCPNCQADLAADAPQGLCPRCLLEGALAEAPRPGSRLRYFGDYELLEEIGRGGMGVVYKARQVSLDRVVAVKWLLAGLHASPDALERFRREARALASLRHPRIVAVHEVGEHDGQPYFSMEHVKGRSLGEVLAGGPLPPERAAGYVRKLAEAVAVAHREGILHRDLKPSNILLDEDDEPRITDFGLAKRLAPEEASLTTSGALLGTPSYMAPEQVRGDEPVRESDVYALGALLYELLTGRPPFRGDSPLAIARQVLEREVEPPRRVSPALPRDLATLCLKCLEKDPARRYRSALELADELGRFLRGEPLTARPVGLFGRAWRWCRRRPWPVAVATLALVAVVFATLYVDRRRAALVEQARSEDDRRLARQQLTDAARLGGSGEVRRAALEILSQPALERLHELSFGDVRHLAFSGDGAWLAVGGNSLVAREENPGWSTRSGWETIEVWDTDSARRLHRTKGDASDGGFAFHPHEPWLLLAQTERKVERRTGDSGEIYWTSGSAVREEAVVWDAAEQRETARLEAPDPVGRGRLGPWLFAPGGGLAVRREGELVRAWSLLGNGVETLPPTGEPVAFLDADQLLLRRGGTLLLWDRRRPREEKVLRRDVLAVSADGRVAVAGGQRIAVIDVPKQETLGILPIPAEDPTRVLLSADGHYLAVLDEPLPGPRTVPWLAGRSVKVWSLNTGTPRRLHLLGTLAVEHNGRIFLGQSAFRPGGALLATFGAEAKTAVVRVWDVETGRLVTSLRGHHRPHWSGDGRLLATVGPGEVRLGPYSTSTSSYSYSDVAAGNAIVHLFRVASAPATYVLDDPVRSLAVSPDGRWLATDATIWEWDGSGAAPRLLRSHFDPIGDAALFDREDRLWSFAAPPPKPGEAPLILVERRLAATPPELARDILLEPADYSEIEVRMFPREGTWVAVPRAVAVSPDGRSLATGSALKRHDGAGGGDAVLEVWDLATGRRAALLAHRQGAWQSVCFSPDGKAVVSTARSGVVVFDAATGRELRTLKHEGPQVVAVSADGLLVASGSYDGTIEVSELTGRKRAKWNVHAGAVVALTLSADGRLLASADAGGLVAVRHLGNGRELARWQAHAGGVTALLLHPDGETLVSGAADGHVKLWHLPSMHRQLAELGLAWDDD